MWHLLSPIRSLSVWIMTVFWKGLSLTEQLWVHRNCTTVGPSENILLEDKVHRNCALQWDHLKTFFLKIKFICSRQSHCNTPQREAGDVWCLPPVWNRRAVIWFHFAISSLVLLPSPVTLSVLSFSAWWPFLLNFFQKILQYFSLRDRLFCMAPV